MITFLLFILKLLGMGVLGLMSIKPLKESAEFRFQKTKPLAEGAFYLGTAVMAFFSWWFLLLGFPVAYLIKKSKGEKLLNP